MDERLSSERGLPFLPARVSGLFPCLRFRPRLSPFLIILRPVSINFQSGGPPACSTTPSNGPLHLPVLPPTLDLPQDKCVEKKEREKIKRGTDKLVLPPGDLHGAVKAWLDGKEAELMLKGQCVRTKG